MFKILPAVLAIILSQSALATTLPSYELSFKTDSSSLKSHLAPHGTRMGTTEVGFKGQTYINPNYVQMGLIDGNYEYMLIEIENEFVLSAESEKCPSFEYHFSALTTEVSFGVGECRVEFTMTTLK